MPSIPDKYTTQTLELDLCHQQVQLTTITNLDDLVDELIAKGKDHEDYQDERLPYWADLWHSAIGLARYLCRKEYVRPNQTVTEIGCGLGLPGVMAGVLGGAVTFTDYLDEALELAAWNWSLNLDGQARFLKMDWRHPLPEAGAEIVLAADVAYEKKLFDALLTTLDTLIPNGGRLLLAEPNRPVARPFVAELKERYSLNDQTVEPVSWNGFTVKVNIFEFIRA
jgi:predicted nicotinamide N-methyase